MVYKRVFSFTYHCSVIVRGRARYSAYKIAVAIKSYLEACPSTSASNANKADNILFEI